MVRKYSGPLQKGKRSAKVPKGRVYKKKAKKGLTVVERRQVNKIINKRAETKYFRVSNAVNFHPLFGAKPGATNTVFVRGYAVGTGERFLAAGVSEVMTFGNTGMANIEVFPLDMARVFTPTSSAVDDRLKPFVPDGNYVSPSLCRTEWSIQRERIDTTSVSKNSNPAYVRFIRVRPRSGKYSSNVVNPKDDLFMNQLGMAYGMTAAANSYQVRFGPDELQNSKINTRQYQVIQDTHFQLLPPSTESNFEIGTGNTQVTNLNKSHQRRLTCYHKQPKKLYYPNIEVANNNGQPAQNQSNEFIFIMACTMGIIGNTNESPNINISVKPVSTFKDI